MQRLSVALGFLVSPMQRIALPVRPDLHSIAAQQGFRFASMYGEPYWDESSAYQFTRTQIEDGIEAPCSELHAMVRAAVPHILSSERLMGRMGIPEPYWDLVTQSWQAGEGELYGRFDLAWSGTGPAKMLEYNADTPTSLYEAGSFQWDWLQDQQQRGAIAPQADQFNRLFEALAERFKALFAPGSHIHFASGQGSEEDYATVEFLAYAAREAGMGAHHVFLDQIGVSTQGQFVDAEDRVMGALFKLYPWEDMLRDDFARHIAPSGCRMIEPAWKALVSNKAILPVLWEMFEGHPNLLAAFFLEDVLAQTESVRRAAAAGHFAQGRVKKPIFSREGASITISDAQNAVLEASANRDYDAHPTIVQAYAPLPVFDGWRPVLGAWVVGEACVGMGVREDRALITQDLSRFKPHYFLD